jgi:hypothetical protein
MSSTLGADPMFAERSLADAAQMSRGWSSRRGVVVGYLRGGVGERRELLHVQETYRPVAHNERFSVAERAVRHVMGAEVVDDSIDRGGLGVGRAVVRGEREVDQTEAIPHRTVNRVDVVDEFKAAQGGGRTRTLRRCIRRKPGCHRRFGRL